ncbi:MAG: ribonuclease Z [Thermodesulfobacteriota bacterium]|nr:ribonuclease Z [Thermodesulfobacteriota bacterium]
MDTARVTILGSGTGVPSLTRSSCSIALEIKDEILLFDIGPGTMRRALEIGITIDRISYLFISHLHPDHTGELVSFLFASKYPEIEKRRNPLTIIGARGLSNFYEGLKKVYGKWIDLDEAILTIIEMENTKPDFMEFGSFDVTTAPMDHIESSIGYRVTVSDGTSLVYTGDTDYCENVIELSRNTDLLVCESALPDEMKAEGHLTPSLAGKIASEANVKALVLIHFYPECEGVDIEAQCRKTYRGDLILATDLMQIGLSPRSVVKRMTT